MSKNQISMVVTDEQLTAALEAVETIKTNLPGLITITKDERKSLIVMGDKTVEFVNKATDYGVKNNGLVPGFIDMNEQNIDVQAVNRLKEIQRQMNELNETIDDTIMLSGSEAFAGALAIYHTIKSAAKNRVEGAKSAYDDLRARFPGRRGNAPFSVEEEAQTA